MSTTATAAQPCAAASGPLLTAEAFCQHYGKLRVELIAGVVKELPMPFPKHGKMCGLIAFHILAHVFKHDCGHVAINDSFVKTKSNPDTVRGGDLCYWSYERQPRGPIPEGLLPAAPELVVEVRSPSQNWVDIFAKVIEYLSAGVLAVVIVDPVSETVSVYRTNEFQHIFHNGDELTIPDVLPGFAFRIHQLFEL